MASAHDTATAGEFSTLFDQSSPDTTSLSAFSLASSVTPDRNPATDWRDRASCTEEERKLQVTAEVVQKLCVRCTHLKMLTLDLNFGNVTSLHAIKFWRTGQRSS